MEELLDESPIASLEEERLSGSSLEDQSEHSHEDVIDAETFKGSFLQEMEKLCRPLKYERRRHNIYEYDEDSEEENILAFIEESEENTYKLDLKTAPLAYIIDFQADPSAECACRCHFNNENRKTSCWELNLVKEEPPREKLRKLQQMEECLSAKEKDGWRKEGEKTWTSLSLKQYKQRIKKKLQQKR